MHRRIWLCLLAACIALATNGCDEAPADRVLSIKATATILGVAYVDRNGNGTIEATTDGTVANVQVNLVLTGGGSTVATATSDAAGGFRLSNVPVGEYELRVNDASVPDSLRLLQVSAVQLRLLAGDSIGVIIAFTFPSIKVRDARTFELGRRVFVEGVTLNALATFGDSTLHVSDSTGTIRATRVLSSAIAIGQRVRLSGVTALQDGQRVLTDVTVFTLGSGVQPPPTPVTTAVAANADGGSLDAALVQVSNAVIAGAQTNAALDVILSVSDGSGLLDIVIDRQSGIATGTFVPGATLTATGVLVPTATAGVWQLKPRSTTDVSATFATVTVAEARQLPAGRIVTIEGVALNSWFVFADSTVHLNDATGSIRATRVAPVNLFAGDRARLLGTIVLRDGQPVLNQVSPTVLGAGVLPLPQVLTTATAATADNGRADAAFVRVLAATIDTTVNVGGDMILTVNDSTGPLDVVLDRDVGFALAPFVKGAVLDVTGVLVTTPGGAVWRLKPRQPGDVIVR